MKKIISIFFISTFVIYIVLTFIKLQQWCTQNQIILFVNETIGIEDLNIQKLEILGKSIERKKELISNENLSNEVIEGYIQWLGFQSVLGNIFSYYASISIITGLAISFGYYILNVIKEKKTILKILLGYLFPECLFVLIYMLIFNLLNNPFVNYIDRNKNIVLFSIIYLLAFMYMIIFNKKKEKKNKE